jgi:hypothetical protein
MARPQANFMSGPDVRNPPRIPSPTRHSDAQQIPDEFRKARLRVLKHHGGTSGNGGKVKKEAPGGQYPE